MEVSPQWITLVRYGATPMFRWDNQKRLGGIDMRIATYYKDVYHVFSLWRIWTSQLQQQSKNLAMVDVPGMWLFASLMGYICSQVTEPMWSLIVLWSYKGMFIHIGVGSALLVLLLMAMRRPRCAGQANDQFPRFFYAVTYSLFYPSCPGNPRYMKNISDGNILFFIRNRNLLYFLWDYCYGGNYDIPLCLIEMYWWRYSSYHTFLLNRFCSIYSTFHSNVFNDRCHGSWG